MLTQGPLTSCEGEGRLEPGEEKAFNPESSQAHWWSEVVVMGL
jgi:hypothetical protein